MLILLNKCKIVRDLQKKTQFFINNFFAFINCNKIIYVVIDNR